MNDLVVTAEPGGPSGWGDFDGARLLQSGQDLKNSDGALETTINGVVATLDLLAVVANPLKEFMMAGVGYVIEHVSFLREPLEWVAGDPNEIMALQQTWSNISTSLSEAASAMADQLSEVDDWRGDDAEGYRGLAKEFSDVLNSAGTVASCMSGYAMLMGLWTATTRALILELICDFVSRGILYLLAAAFSSVVTFGGSIAAAITGLVLDALASFGKIMKRIGTLLEKVADLMKRFDAAGDLLSKMGKWFDGKGSGLINSSNLKLESLRLNALNSFDPGELPSWLKTSYMDNKSTIFNDSFMANYKDFWGSNANWFSKNLHTLGEGSESIANVVKGLDNFANNDDAWGHWVRALSREEEGTGLRGLLSGILTDDKYNE
ncbi:hypothetical protein AB0B28_09195 [Glycomyces sp. NPDC046736]|uniref:hypothetical protein n=1 Tax=Glycomyces sp. NPDC046736 TaxID=3155615 RepID=UPI0033E6576A